MRSYDKAIGHGISDAGERALQFALAVDPGAHRYDLADWASRYPALASWTEQARYEHAGARDAATVQPLLGEVRTIVDRIAFCLWADGRLPGGFSW